MSIFLLVLAVASGALLAYWACGLRQALATMRLPTARAGAALPAAAARVCVVIPAHNEARHIAPLVGSLRRQDAASLRVVLALDRCTDGTGALAQEACAGDPRFEVIEVETPPPGWAGKVHAVWSGVTRSAGARDADYLLFADADTTFDPACVRASVALAQELGADLFSLLCTLTNDRAFELLAQPAAGLELMRQFPLPRVNNRRRPRAFANGQFMLFRREAYEALGGHEAVKSELLEDLALARRAVSAGRPISVLFADGMVRCRMYESWAEFRRGWRRIYTESAKRRPDRLTNWAWRARLFGTVLPLCAVAAVLAAGVTANADGPVRAAAGILGAMGLAAWLEIMVLSQVLTRAPLWAVPLQLFGAWEVGGLLAAAARDLRRGNPTTWAGLEYVRPARRAGSPEG